MIWALAVALVLAVGSLAFQTYLLANELRRTHQTMRARINELEGERSAMIKQVAEARGVQTDDPTDPLGLSPKAQQPNHVVDQITGNTIYDDGTIVAANGEVLVRPGQELTAELAGRVL